MAKGPIEFCGPLGAISQQLWAGYSEKLVSGISLLKFKMNGSC
ncbi:MAG: hypothetical protein ACJAS2_000741 [Pseudohongiellaceae bacterium]|jgi:hypothetical protein